MNYASKTKIAKGNIGHIDLNTRGGYGRAVDWQMFILFLVPTIVCDMINMQANDNKRYLNTPGSSLRRTQSLIGDSYEQHNLEIENRCRDTVSALKNLSSACAIALQYKISQTDISELKRLVTIR